MQELTITISGAAGTGKTTLAHLIRRALPWMRVEVVDPDPVPDDARLRMRSLAIADAKVTVRTVSTCAASSPTPPPWDTVNVEVGDVTLCRVKRAGGSSYFDDVLCEGTVTSMEFLCAALNKVSPKLQELRLSETEQLRSEWVHLHGTAQTTDTLLRRGAGRAEDRVYCGSADEIEALVSCLDKHAGKLFDILYSAGRPR